MQGLEDIPRLYLGAPPNDPQPWETNASVLRDSIAFDDGQAIIELKDSESKRFRESHGYREALTAGQFETAMHMLYSRGVEIIDVHNTFGAVEVLMNRDKVFELYDHPMVDYIDFPLEFGLGWNLPKE
ncbi:MAG: hypothetical protein JJU13_00590 [Balneolaceae bacterium]|nr:hypothetical protein [Balneolaceae bacterium]